MTHVRLSVSLLILAFGLYGTVRAALPPLSPGELEKFADLIVTGSVSNIEAAQDGFGNNLNWVYTLKAKIDSVEKGDGTKAGDTITIRCWSLARRPAGWAGPSGHGPIPARESRFRMWLKPHEDGGWEPLKPNGIELLDGSPAFVTPELKGGPVSWLGLYAGIAMVAVLAILGIIFVGRKMKSGPDRVAEGAE